VIEFRFHFIGCFQGDCEKPILDGHDSLLCVPTQERGNEGGRKNSDGEKEAFDLLSIPFVPLSIPVRYESFLSPCLLAAAH
jgi:hypothetical protein